MIKVKRDGVNLQCDQITALILLSCMDAGIFHVRNNSVKSMLEKLKKNLEAEYIREEGEE